MKARATGVAGTAAADLALVILAATAFAGLLSAGFFLSLVLVSLLSFAIASPTIRPTRLVWLIAIIFALLSLMKKPESDLLFYFKMIEQIRIHGWHFFQAVSGSSLRLTEPLFFLYLSLFGLTPHQNALFVIISVLLIYVPVGFVVIRIAESRNVSPVVAVIFTMLLSVTVFSATHLVRQYVALSFFMVAMLFWLQDRRKPALILALATVAIHNSMAIFLACLAAAMFMQRRPLLTMIGLVAVTLSLRSYLATAELLANALDKDDGSLPPWLLISDAILLIGLVALWWPTRRRDGRLDFVVMFSVVLAIMFLSVADQRLLMLRSYVMMEFWRPVMVIFALGSFSGGRSLLTNSAVVLVSVTAFLVRLDNNPWDYGGRLDWIAGAGFGAVAERAALFYAPAAGSS